MDTERMGQFWEFVYGSEIRGGDAVFRATSIIGGDQGGQYFLNQNESTPVPPYQGDSYKDAALEFTGDNNLLIIGGNYDSNFNPDYTVRTNKSGSPASRYNFEYVAGAMVTEGGYAYRRDEIYSYQLQGYSFATTDGETGAFVALNRYGEVSLNQEERTWRKENGEIKIYDAEGTLVGTLEGNIIVNHDSGKFFSLTGVQLGFVDDDGTLKHFNGEKFLDDDNNVVTDNLKNIGHMQDGLLIGPDGRIQSFTIFGDTVDTGLFIQNGKVFSGTTEIGTLNGNWIETPLGLCYLSSDGLSAPLEATWRRTANGYDLFNENGDKIGSISDVNSSVVLNDAGEQAYFTSVKKEVAGEIITVNQFAGYLLEGTSYIVDTAGGKTSGDLYVLNSSGTVSAVTSNNNPVTWSVNDSVYSVEWNISLTTTMTGTIQGDLIKTEIGDGSVTFYNDSTSPAYTYDYEDCGLLYQVTPSGRLIQLRAPRILVGVGDNVVSRYDYGSGLMYDLDGYVYEAISIISSSKRTFGFLTEEGILQWNSVTEQLVTEFKASGTSSSFKEWFETAHSEDQSLYQSSLLYYVFDYTTSYASDEYYRTWSGTFVDEEGTEVLLDANNQYLGFNDGSSLWFEAAYGSNSWAAQKTISAVKFDKAGQLNFTAQTGGINPSLSGAENIYDTAAMDRGIRIKAENINLIPQGGDSVLTYRSGSSSFDAYGILSGSGSDVDGSSATDSGLLQILSDLPAEITASATASVTGLISESGQGAVSNSSDNTIQAAAIRADDFYLKNNFIGNLSANVTFTNHQYEAGMELSGNKISAQGIWALKKNIEVSGFWGDTSNDDMLRGIITAAVRNVELFNTPDYWKPANDGSFNEGNGTVSDNAIGAYGLRADAGSLLLTSYNGTIETTVDDVEMRATSNRADNPVATIANNTVYSRGLSAADISFTGMFTGDITSYMNHVWQVRVGPPEGLGNEIATAAIYADTTITFSGRMNGSLTVYTNDVGDIKESGGLIDPGLNVYTAGIYAGSSLTLNNGNSLLAADIRTETYDVQVYTKGGENAYGIYAPTLSASAMDSEIHVTTDSSVGRAIALWVTTYKNAADATFDITGNITLDGRSDSSASEVRVAVLKTANDLNIRIASNIIIDPTGATEARYAVFSGNVTGPNSFVKQSYDDIVEIASGAEIVGNFDLTEGKNTYTIDSNATITGDLLSMNGTTNIEFVLNRWRAVDDVGWESQGAHNENFIINSLTGETGTETGVNITVNLNEAEDGTYKLISGLNNKDRWLDYWVEPSKPVYITLTFDTLQDVRFTFAGVTPDADGVYTVEQTMLSDDGKNAFVVTAYLTGNTSTNPGELTIDVDREIDLTATELVANSVSFTTIEDEDENLLKVSWRSGVSNAEKGDCRYRLTYTETNKKTGISEEKSVDYTNGTFQADIETSDEVEISDLAVYLIEEVPPVSDIQWNAETNSLSWNAVSGVSDLSNCVYRVTFQVRGEDGTVTTQIADYGTGTTSCTLEVNGEVVGTPVVEFVRLGDPMDGCKVEEKDDTTTLVSWTPPSADSMSAREYSYSLSYVISTMDENGTVIASEMKTVVYDSSKTSVTISHEMNQTVSDVTVSLQESMWKDVSTVSLTSAYNSDTDTVRLDWSYWGPSLNNSYQYEVEYSIITYDENGSEIDRTNSIVANLAYNATYFEIYDILENQKVIARVRLNNKGSSSAYQNGEWSQTIEVAGTDVVPEIGQPAGTRVRGGESSVLFLEWNRCSCEAGLSFYEINYLTIDDEVLKAVGTIKESDLWDSFTKLSNLLASGSSAASALGGVDEYGNYYLTAIEVKKDDGSTETIELIRRIMLFRKTTTADTLFVSGLDNGLNLYWRVRAVSNTYQGEQRPDSLEGNKASGVGEWTLGDSIKIDTKDLTPPEIIDSSKAEAINTQQNVFYIANNLTDAERTISVKWENFAEDPVGGTGLKGYKLYYVQLDESGNEIGEYQYCPLAEYSGQGSFSIEDIKLDARSDYRWYIAAVDKSGNQSTPSAATNTIGIWYGDSDAVQNVNFSISGDILYTPVSSEWYQTLSFKIDISEDTESEIYTPSGTYLYVLQVKEIDNTTGEEVWVTKAQKFAEDISDQERMEGFFYFTGIKNIKKGFANDGSNQWRLTVYDTAGNASFKELSTPYDVTPAHFAEGDALTVSYDYNTSDESLVNVTVTWNRATDEVNGSMLGQSGVYEYTIVLSALDGSGVLETHSIIVTNPDPDQQPETYSYTFKNLSANAEYNISVTVRDKINKAEGFPGRPVTISQDIIPDQEPPDFTRENIKKTIVNYDESGLQIVRLRFIEATDLQSGVAKYTISYWQKGSSDITTIEITPADLKRDPSEANVKYYELHGILDERVEYEWSISATDNRGQESDLITGLVWGYDNVAPGFEEDATGVLSSEITYVPVEGSDFYGIQVTVSWDPAIDNPVETDDYLVNSSGIVSYTVQYRYQIGEGEFSSWITIDPDKSHYEDESLYPYNGTSCTITAPVGNATYEWRVVNPVDKCGNHLTSGQFGYSLTNTTGWAGDTTDPTFTGEITVYTPEFNNGTLDVSMSWNPATDAESGVLGYAVYYRVAGMMSWILANGVEGESDKIDWNAVKYNSQTKTYEYSLIGVVPANVSYECRVVAYDKVGNYAEILGTFDGDITPPEFDGTASAQVIGYQEYEGELDWRQNVTITWNPATDGSVEDDIVISGVEYYTLQIKLTSDPDSAYNLMSYRIYLTEDSKYPDRIVLDDQNMPYINLYDDLGILLKNGDYTCRILATDKADNTTAIADAITIDWVGDHEGPVFELENIIDITVEYDQTTLIGGNATQNVTITWNPADDGENGSGVRGYTLRYKLDDEKVKTWITVPGLITDTTYTLTGLAHGNYVFEITAYDNVSNSTVVSSSWGGDVTAPIFPRTDTEVKVDKNNNVTINWKSPAKEDPDVEPQSGVKEYVFTFHRDGTDADVVYTVTVSDPTLSSYVFTSSFWDDLQDGTYTWTMVAVDYAGNKSEELSGDSFIIDREAPHGPSENQDGWFTLLPEPEITVEYDWFPQPGVKGLEDPVDVRDPINITVTFDASNNNFQDPTGVYFIYEISLDGTFRDESKLLYSSKRDSDYTYSDDPTSTDVYQGDTLVLSTENNGITRLAGYAPGTVFYWRAKAVDGRGHEVSNWSYQVTSFTLTDSEGNNIVDLYTNPTKPLSVGVTCDNDFSNVYTVSWQPSTDAFGIAGYYIEISNSLETQIEYVDASEISSLRVATWSMILNSGTYNFRVQSVDGSGRKSAWSDKFTYTVSEEIRPGYEDGLSSSWAYTLQNGTLGTDHYTTSTFGTIGLASDSGANYCWYKFDLLNQGKSDADGLLSGVLNLTLTGVTSPLTISIYDDTKKVIKKFSVKNGFGGITNLLIDPAKYGERIYLMVEAGQNATKAQYTINADLSFFDTPDYDDLKTNPQWQKLISTETGAALTVHGWVGYQDKGDYYMFTGDAAATVQGIDITGVTGKLKVTLYDNAWKKKASVTISEDAYGLFSGQLIPEVYFVAVETTDSGKGKVNSYYNLNVSENYLPANKPSSNPGNVVSLDANGYYASTDEWVGYGDAVDYYSFSTTHAGALNVSINVKQNATLKVTLYQFVDGKQKKLKSVTVKSTTNNTNLFKDYLVPVGDFMITVESGDKGKGKQNSYYDLMVSDQYKHPASPNSSFATADQGTLVVNQPTTAANDLWVGYGDPVDYYEVNVAGDGVFNLGVYDLSAKVKVFVYEKDANGVAGKKIATATLNAGTSTNSAFKNNLMLTAGNYYVVVESADKKTAKQETAYNLNFNGTYFTNDNHLNDNSAWDVDTVAQAQTLAANETIQLSGWVGFNDASDFFRFELNGSSMVRLDFSNFNSTNLKYEVRSVETNKKVSFDQNGMSKEQLSGAYYVEISTKNEKKYYSNDYTLGITAV